MIRLQTNQTIDRIHAAAVAGNRVAELVPGSDDRLRLIRPQIARTPGS